MTTTLTARGPEDLLAAVPVVLGFRPARLARHAHLRRRRTASTPGSTCRLPDEADGLAAGARRRPAGARPETAGRPGGVRQLQRRRGPGRARRRGPATGLRRGRHRRGRRAARPRRRLVPGPGPPDARETSAGALRRHEPPVRGPGRLRGPGDPRQPRRAPRHRGRLARGGGPGAAGASSAGRRRARRTWGGCATWWPALRHDRGCLPTTRRRRGSCERWSGPRSATPRSSR